MNKRRKYFIRFVGLVLSGTLITFILANNQKSQNKKQYEDYLIAQEMISQEDKIDEGIIMIKSLQENNPNSESLYLMEAQAYSNKNDFENAKVALDKALDMKKDLWNNVSVLIMYGEVSYLDNDYKTAKDMITRAQKIGIPEQYKGSVEEILQKIN